MKISTLTILKTLANNYPDTTVFRKNIIENTARDLGFTGKDFVPLLTKEARVKIGTYDLTPVMPKPEETPYVPKPTTVMSMVASVTNSEKTLVEVDPTFVPWGPFADITKILKSQMFFPVYISGLSGNGKTFMAEQACAKLKRQVIRVQINPETDEDDLIGGFRLINGETVFAKGPVLKAMESGSILLLDEIDRATNKIMCLQGILEGKPVLVKKTGDIVKPAPGFNVIATANTKGKGSEDGRFTAASIIDDAFLERFNISIDQKFPSKSIEEKILNRHFEKFNSKPDIDFVTHLVNWADIIRKTFYDDGIDEVVSTRRLCHIVQTFAIFDNKSKAIDLCISRFDDDTKEAFLDLYSKVDAGVIIHDKERDFDKIVDEVIHSY
tara:strand:- start:9805 stop:10953 length:1149 start_codon:yes stop_codon:yes gene_type:complete